MNYLLAFLLSLFTVVLLRYPFTLLAVKLDFLDKPTGRKAHKEPTPLIGGIIMFISFTVSFAIFLRFQDIKYIAILTGSVLIIAIGLVDDWYKTKGKEFRVLPRAIIQMCAIIIVYASGIRFTGFMNPLTDIYVELPPLLQFILTITWIFGVTTVINWSDGMDGLAGGLSAISGITFFIASLVLEQEDSAFMAVILVGTVLGFLKYNLTTKKSKIFMGDSGANFLGFILAVTSLHGAFKQATVISMFVPVLALGVPIFDNLFVVVKRFINKKPIYGADASQIHHRLLKTGMKPRQVVMVLFLLSACLNLTSIIILLLMKGIPAWTF